MQVRVDCASAQKGHHGKMPSFPYEIKILSPVVQSSSISWLIGHLFLFIFGEGGTWGGGNSSGNNHTANWCMISGSNSYTQNTQISQPVMMYQARLEHPPLNVFNIKWHPFISLYSSTACLSEHVEPILYITGENQAACSTSSHLQLILCRQGDSFFPLHSDWCFIFDQHPCSLLGFCGSSSEVTATSGLIFKTVSVYPSYNRCANDHCHSGWILLTDSSHEAS